MNMKFRLCGKEKSVKETHQGFLSRSIPARRRRSAQQSAFAPIKKDTLQRVFFYWCERRNPFFDKTVRKTGFIHMVREMRLELTRRLPHAPQTCLSTYSSTLAYNFRLLSYYTHSFCICQVFYFFLAGCSITFLLALRPDIWYNTSCMYTKEGGRGGCRSFLFRRTMCAEAF